MLFYVEGPLYTNTQMREEGGAAAGPAGKEEGAEKKLPEQAKLGRSESAAFLEDYFTTIFDAGKGAQLEGEGAQLNENGYADTFFP